MGRQGRRQPQQQQQQQRKQQEFKDEVERQRKQLSGEPCNIRVVYVEKDWKFMHVCNASHEISSALTTAGQLGIRKLCEETGLQEEALGFGPSIGIQKSPSALYDLKEWTRNGFLMVFPVPEREQEGILGKLKAAKNQLKILEEEGIPKRSQVKDESKGKNKMEGGDGLEQQLSQLEGENDGLRQEVSDLTQEVSTLRQENSRHKNRVSELKQRLRLVEEECTFVRGRAMRFSSIHRRIVVNKARKKAAEEMHRAPEHNESWGDYFDAVAPPPSLSQGVLRLLKDGAIAGNRVAHEAPLLELAESVCEDIKDRSLWVETFKYAYGEDPEELVFEERGNEGAFCF